MSALDQNIIYELSRMAIGPVGHERLSNFISKHLTRLFAAKYHMFWLVKNGLAYPLLYSLDEDLISNLYTQQLIKTAYPLVDLLLKLTH
jgi:hypothetical protein